MTQGVRTEIMQTSHQAAKGQDNVASGFKRLDTCLQGRRSCRCVVDFRCVPKSVDLLLLHNQ
jgi:hypothetical protein